MTRYIVEYRRWCPFTKELTEWTNFITTHDQNRAVEMYAQHVSNHPTEEARMISLTGEYFTYYEFDPNKKEEEEEDAA